MLRKLLVSSGFATLLTVGACSTAQADDWAFSFGFASSNIIDCTGPQRVWVEPVYETRCENVWVEPVYRTEHERVWIEPIIRKECEQVWVPDRYEWRDVPVRDRYGRTCYERRRVLVERGYWRTVEREVVVRAGYWSTIERQVCVQAGGWQTVERRVCVREGYWVDTGVQSSIYLSVGYDGYPGRYDSGRSYRSDEWDYRRYDSKPDRRQEDHRFNNDRENRSREPDRYQERDRREDGRDRSSESRNNRRDGTRDRGDRYR